MNTIEQATKVCQYSSKYYKMDETTIGNNFWLNKPEPPPNVPDIFPVGHPSNPGVQTVWKATDREVKYFDSKRFFVPTVPFENIRQNNDKNFYDTLHSNVLYCGKFTVENGSHNCSLVKSLLPEDKMTELEGLASEYGSTFWLRSIEAFGSNIAQITSSMAKDFKDMKLKVLMVAGSNFQGAACVTAARHLASMGNEVFISCFNSKGDEGFIGTSPNDLSYENINVVFDMRAIKKEKFHVLVLGADDFRSPTTSLYVYKHWLPKTNSVILIDPPMIPKSYSFLIEEICKQKKGSSSPTTLIYAIRPSPITMDEKSTVFVVNIPTTNSRPGIGNNCTFNIVKPFMGKTKKKTTR